jgi:nicotinate-nucleotide adenylyltransferase
MKIGLLFGTFDPVHLGHIQIGRSLFDAQLVDKIWFIITPCNPLKRDKKISSTKDRFAMVSIALRKYTNFIASDIEFNLELPNYTSTTLRYIKKTYSKDKFVVIMGSDNYSSISKWKDAQYILDNFEICVYQRPGETVKLSGNTTCIPGKQMDISSSYIRNSLSLAGTKKLLDNKVLEYINQNSLYQ